MKFAHAFILCILLQTSYCHAQMMTNSWGERDGVNVASEQVVSVPALSLRFFSTIRHVEETAEAAIENVENDKKAVLEAVAKIGVPKDSVRFTAVRILEQDQRRDEANYFSSARDDAPLLLAPDFLSFTAVAYCRFDVSLKNIAGEKLSLFPLEIHKQLQSHPAFEDRNLHALFVGEVTKQQAAAAKLKAYNEAAEEAKDLMKMTGKPLGKLKALTPFTYSAWHRSWHRNNDSPASKFSAAENEVLGTDPQELSRTYSIQLRYDIE